MTFGDSLKYNEHLLHVIEKCNADKQAIREINNFDSNWFLLIDRQYFIVILQRIVFQVATISLNCLKMI